MLQRTLQPTYYEEQRNLPLLLTNFKVIKPSLEIRDLSSLEIRYLSLKRNLEYNQRSSKARNLLEIETKSFINYEHSKTKTQALKYIEQSKKRIDIGH